MARKLKKTVKSKIRRGGKVAKKVKPKAARGRGGSTQDPGETEDVYERIRRQRRETAGRGSRFWRPAEGDNIIRLVPFKHGGVQDVFAFAPVHYAVEDGESKGFAPCPGEGCPICAFVDEFEQDSRPPFVQQKRWLANVIVREAPNVTGTNLIKVGQFKFRDHGKLVTAITGDKAPKNCLDLKMGRDILLHREGSGRDVAYFAKPARAIPSAVGVDFEPEDLLATVEGGLLSDGEYEAIAAHLRELFEE